MKINRDKKGRFIKGNNIYKHPKGFRASIGTEFKKNNIPYNFKGINKPRIQKSKRDGNVYIVTIDKKRKTVSRKRKYYTKRQIAYARLVVGLENIPRGYVVYHNDGNALNNEFGNLLIISRAELLKLNFRI